MKETIYIFQTEQGMLFSCNEEEGDARLILSFEIERKSLDTQVKELIMSLADEQGATVNLPFIQNIDKEIDN